MGEFASKHILQSEGWRRKQIHGGEHERRF